VLYLVFNFCLLPCASAPPVRHSGSVFGPESSDFSDLDRIYRIKMSRWDPPKPCKGGSIALFQLLPFALRQLWVARITCYPGREAPRGSANSHVVRSRSWRYEATFSEQFLMSHWDTQDHEKAGHLPSFFKGIFFNFCFFTFTFCLAPARPSSIQVREIPPCCMHREAESDVPFGCIRKE
jgi:hypothetical protein